MVPFTLAHPAAVLPLRRTQLVFSALVIGSVAPDLPYFLTLSDNLRSWHSVHGVFLFCLPVGLILLWLFHRVVKRPLVALAPEYVRVRISPEELEFRFGPWWRFLLIVASLLIGTFAHILWDGFTHDHGYFVKHWEWLSMPVISPLITRNHHMPLWRALQHWCSVIGVLAVMVTSAWYWIRKPVLADSVPQQFTSMRRMQILAAGLLLAAAIGVVAGLAAEGHHYWKWLLVKMTIVFISAMCAEVLLYSVAWHFQYRKKQKPHDRESEGLKVMAER